ncbi:MAG: hypothetical protein WAU42_08915 [Solirubrobacteraceae bacterium]
MRQLTERALPVGVEHDPTVPPVGRMLDGRLVETDDGELAMEATMEVRARPGIPAVFRPASDFYQVAHELPRITAQRGELAFDIDRRSYQASDLESLRAIAGEIGDASSSTNALRFSQVPDALLMIELGGGGGALWWFSKGFFTRLGEHLADKFEAEALAAYCAFKDKLKDVLTRRTPADRPPITVMTIEIRGEGGQAVLVEGSSRADGDVIEDFLDAGEDLLLLGRVCTHGL